MMPKAYSNDLRERVIQACDQGERAAAVAKRFAMSESFIEKLKQRRRERGTVAPKPPAGGRQPLLAAHSERIRAALQTKPDTTLAELRDGLGLSVALSTLWYHLRRLGLTFKKNAEGRRTGPPGREPGTGVLAGAATALGTGAPGVRG
jgi:transposase